MNTFFRQKLTNKMIDLLEKVEDRKQGKEEDECFVLGVTYYFDNSRFTSSDYFRNDTSNFLLFEKDTMQGECSDVYFVE